MFTHMRQFDFVVTGKGDVTCNTKILGTPIDGMRQFVLDDEGKQITEPHQTGTLWVSGVGVSRGYHREPEKTASSFVPLARLLPAQTGGIPGEMAYNTQDLVYALPSGEVVFVGRRDGQIKIGGRRVELEGVAAVFAPASLKARNFPHTFMVRQVHAVAFPRVSRGVQEGTPPLANALEIVLFFCPNQFSRSERHALQVASALQVWASQYLRIEEQPTVFLSVGASFPLTSNDKMDQKALLDMYTSHVASCSEDDPAEEI